MPGIASLASMLGARASTKTSNAYLLELDQTGSPVAQFHFQYFPETISDSKAVNYQTKDVPGGSLPLYQWISSGERSISFTAVFTSDVDLGVTSDGYGVLSKKSLPERLKSIGASSRNIDIRSALVLLRRYVLPRYAVDSTGLTVAPATLSLFIPNSGIGAAGGCTVSSASSMSDSVNCKMTQCEATYEAFFPSGVPRVATVQLAFVQIAQGDGEVVFPSRTDFMDRFATERTGGALGYSLLDQPGFDVGFASR